MAATSGVHRKLLVGTVIAAVGTLLFYATGIDWSWALKTQKIPSAATVYLMTACFGALPYGLLAALLIRRRSSPFFHVVSFVLVIALAVVAFSWWRLHDIRTNGWDFLLVPLWQTALIAVLHVAQRVAGSLTSKRRGIVDNDA